MTEKLNPDTGGTWIVTTKGSSYILDLDESLGVRTPSGEEVDGYQSLSLRRDGEIWKVEEVIKCEVGESMELYARGINKDPRILTFRQTTPVVKIEKIGEKGVGI